MDDLISRDAARNVINTWICNRNVVDRIKFIHSDLSALPSIDVAPVKHGKWLYKDRHRKSYRQYTGFDDAGEMHTITVLQESEGKEPYCSECGAQAAESFLDYCPHCGARMDGEAKCR